VSNDILFFYNYIFRWETLLQITFLCSNCQTNLEVAADNMGKDIECPSCAVAVTVPKQEPGPGTTLGGFYIKSLIGVGGMGNVFLATQLSMERDVALKVLSAAVTRDPEDLERFMNEVRVTAKLEHPNIVSAYEAGEDDGYYYMAIAYVNGLSLDKKIHQSKNKRLKEKESLRIIKKIALALSYAWNDHGMLHRDVKPENILLDAHGEPKLADFGLSRTNQQAKRVTSHGTIMGTPNYMSPEQMDDLASADKRSDIYSLGATLYQMLTGKIPFDGSSVIKTFKLIATESLDDPRKYNPNISLHTIKLLEKMMARNADDRYQTWKDCLNDISLILNGKPLLTPRLSAGKSVIKIAKPAQRNNNAAKKAVTSQKQKETNLVPVLATIAVLVILVLGLIKISDIHKQKQRKIQLIARENAKKAAIIEKEAILKERYDDLIHYLNTNPENYYGRIIKLKSALASDFKNTKYTNDIRKKLATAMTAHDKDISLTWETLYNKSQKMFNAGQVEEAVNMLRTYSGKYASEIKEERYSRATALENNYKKQIVNNTKKINSNAIIDKALNSLADALIAMDFDTVSDIITKIDNASLPADVATKWNKIKSHAAEAAKSHKLVILSFSNDTGKSVSISLKDKTTVSMRISRVSNNTIYGRSLVRTGGSYKNYNLTIDDISEFEYFKRLGPAKSPGLDIMRGILSASANLPASARKYFNNANCPLGRLIEKKLNVF
jgi:serine/threonine-protein kinase